MKDWVLPCASRATGKYGPARARVGEDTPHTAGTVHCGWQQHPSRRGNLKAGMYLDAPHGKVPKPETEKIILKRIDNFEALMELCLAVATVCPLRASADSGYGPHCGWPSSLALRVGSPNTVPCW